MGGVRAGVIAIRLALSAIPGAAAEGGAPDPPAAQVKAARELIDAHRPGEALPLLDSLIARTEARVHRDPRTSYCATGSAEALFYLALSAASKHAAVVLAPEECEAWFLKAYALTERKRESEAASVLERLTALAPMNVRYLDELGFAYRSSGQPDKAMAAYQRARDSSAPADDPAQDKRWRGAAWRGIGYLLIDRQDWAGAERAYRESLKLDPANRLAQSELDFIAKRRPQ